jgi:phosphotransferase system HPr (HPr) family protein
MKEVELVIHNASGLHARPAKVFVNTAKKFKSNIKLLHGTKKANAKSMISILTLGVESGGQIRLIVDGPDEDEALQVLKAAVEEGLGDEHPQPEKQATAKKEAAPPKITTPTPPEPRSTGAPAIAFPREIHERRQSWFSNP